MATDLQTNGDSTGRTTLGNLTERVISDDRLFNEIAAVMRIAHTLFKSERNNEASQLLRTAGDLFEQLPGSSCKDALAANMKTLYGITLTAERRQAEATEQFKESIRLHAAIGDNAGLYVAKLAEGVRLRDSKRTEEALALFRQAEAIDRTHNVEVSSRRKYSLQVDIVAALIKTDAEAEVARQIDEALKWIPPVHCTELYGLLLQKGNYSTLFGHYDEALSAYRKGVEVAESMHEDEMKIRLLARIALCYRTQAERTADGSAMQQSVSYRRMALESYIKTGAVKEALIQYRELTSALQTLQEYAVARETCFSAAEMASRHDLPSEDFKFTAHAGFLSLQLQDYDAALDLYTRAYRLPSSNSEDRQRVVAELARLHYREGNMDESVRLLHESCDLLAQTGNQNGEVKEREVLALLLDKVGRAEDASSHLVRIQELRRSQAAE